MVGKVFWLSKFLKDRRDIKRDRNSVDMRMINAAACTFRWGNSTMLKKQRRGAVSMGQIMYFENLLHTMLNILKLRIPLGRQLSHGVIMFFWECQKIAFNERSERGNDNKMFGLKKNTCIKSPVSVRKLSRFDLVAKLTGPHNQGKTGEEI